MEYKRDKRSPTPKNGGISRLMSNIKGTNTKPELLVRKLLQVAGFRGYRLNYKKLPGKPDIVFNKRKVAIFINGCYWHGCEVCGWKPPKHNTEYWVNKISKNKERDVIKKRVLEDLGYRVIVIWDHEIKQNANAMLENISSFLVDK